MRTKKDRRRTGGLRYCSSCNEILLLGGFVGSGVRVGRGGVGVGSGGRGIGSGVGRGGSGGVGSGGVSGRGGSGGGGSGVGRGDFRLLAGGQGQAEGQGKQGLVQRHGVNPRLDVGQKWVQKNV